MAGSGSGLGSGSGTTQRPNTYTYTKLDDLKVGDKDKNIYGVRSGVATWLSRPPRPPRANANDKARACSLTGVGSPRSLLPSHT